MVLISETRAINTNIGILSHTINRKLNTDFPETRFHLKREIFGLPPSAKFILFLLRTKGPLNRKQIIQETLMPERTVGFAMKKLLEKSLIQKVDPNYSRYNNSQQKKKYRKYDRRCITYAISSPLIL